MRGLTTLAPEPTVVNTSVPAIRCVLVSRREAGAGVDVSPLGGPGPLRGIGLVAPPAYDVVPRLESDPRVPVISANQVTMWAALRRRGTRAVGPYQALIDASARSGTVRPGRTSGSVLPQVPRASEEKQQEGWT
ncbi:hypothetical protein SHKM778_82090 [Streptomyces sp. KM77-8]|uniref:LysR substrate-binding domain-containing protein n=1 Tax=Streptomyces haneummycinicus TaxID=3074435 RepID=A0AAT9HXJ8_9ACTN